MTKLNDGEMLEKSFNYQEGGAVIWFEVTSSNRYRVRTEAGIRVTDELLDELALLVGPQNMSFTRS